MLFDIRGSNGAGKSYMVEKLLDKYEHEDFHWTVPYFGSGTRKLESVGLRIPKLNCIVMGRHDIPSGGCDALQRDLGSTYKMQVIIEEIVKFCYPHPVVMYGFMVAGNFDRWNKMAIRLKEEYSHEVSRFCFLTTPVEQCLNHILDRRERRGDARPYKAENLYKHHAQVVNTRTSLINAGRVVVDVDWETGPTTIEQLIIHNV